MSAPNALNVLIELAEKEVELATESLGRAIKAQNDAEEKGAMLRSYRQDYVANLHKSLANGLNKEMHLNYQNFLLKLDQAIDGQDSVIISAQYQVQKEREVWQEAQRKKLSYEVLVKRAQKKEHQKALKKEQKMMDEYAMRSKRGLA